MRIRLLFCLLMLTALPALAAESGDFYIGASRGTDLHDAPSVSAPVLDHLDRLTNVKVLQRKRGWAEIEVSQPKKLKGWVAEGSVRERYRPTTTQKAKSSFFSGFARFFGSSEPKQQQTAVLGVRGLDEGGNATGGGRNVKAVQWMESLNVSQDEVNRFVREGKLNP